MRFRTRTLELETGDKALAERMLAGDEEAFEDFFEKHFPGLYRFALARLKDPEETRDLVQSSILKAIAHLETYRGEASLSAWLYTICRNEISQYYKRRGRTPEAVELVEEDREVRAVLDALGTTISDPEKTVERKEVVGLVHATLDHLPSNYGRALEWKYLDGVSVKEIAQRLEMAPKAAESLLTRARNAFREGFSAANRVPLTAWRAS